MNLHSIQPNWAACRAVIVCESISATIIDVRICNTSVACLVPIWVVTIQFFFWSMRNSHIACLFHNMTVPSKRGCSRKKPQKSFLWREKTANARNFRKDQKNVKTKIFGRYDLFFFIGYKFYKDLHKFSGTSIFLLICCSTTNINCVFYIGVKIIWKVRSINIS